MTQENVSDGAAPPRAGWHSWFGTLTVRTLLGTAVLTALVAVVMAILIGANARLDEASDQRGRTDVLIAEANRAEKLLLDLETGQRGYVITQREAFLAPVRSARHAFPAATARLVRDTRGYPREHRLALAIQAEGAAYFSDWIEPVVQLARTSSAKAHALVMTGGGKRRVDALRSEFEALDAAVARRRAAETRDATDATDRARTAGLAGLAALILVALLFALYLARSVVRPVRHVAGAADRLAAGDLAARVLYAGTGEAGQLARSFNAMASALAASRAALEDEQARSAGVLEAATEYSIIATDLDGLITVFNVGAERMLGYRADELVGRETPALIHDPAEVAARAAELGIEPGFEVFVAAATGGEAETREWTYVRKDGSRLPVTLSVTAVHSGGGEPVGFLGVATDLTERKRADQEIRRLIDERDLVLSSAGVGIFRIDLEGRATYVNPEAARLIGIPSEDLLGRNMHETTHHTRPDGSPYPVDQCPIYAAFADGATHRVDDEVFWTPGGRSFPVEYTSAPTYENGEITGAVAIFNDISERREAQEAAEAARSEALEARAEAERANRAKSEFLSRMSHELRTPLNAVLGFGQLLQMADLDEDDRESVTHIMRGGRHLLDLINEVLDISRIEAGNLAISPEPVRVGDAIADAMSLVRPLAEEREVRLVHALGPLDDMHVLADRQRLKQVLLNLASNAIKYNRRGRSAEVFLEESPDGRLRIGVRDEGAGIPADRLERLFVPFDRLGAEATEVEGTGLGLALSQRLVDVMGGTLTVESEVGVGSTFTVELNRAESPEEARSKTPPGARPILGLPELPAAKILYVEDNVSNLRLAEQILAGQPQVELIAALEGARALELAREAAPDLILLDLHLPDMPGTEVLERLKADRATEAIPVVVLSADATDRQIARLMDRGARDYLTKPLDLERFFDVIATVLGARDNAAG